MDSVAEHVGAEQPIIGRESELAAITEFLAASSERGGAQLLVGPAGVGKSRLLEEASRIAAASGSRVIATTGVEFEVGLGYAGLNRLLAPLRAEFDSLDPPHRQALEVALGYASGPPPLPLLVYGATLTLLEHISRRQPVVVIVDDLAWLDEASAKALVFVAQRVTGTRIAFLGATRDILQPSMRSHAIANLIVQPLNDDQSELLIDRSDPRLAHAARHRILQQAQGNPLAILELSRVVRQLPAGVSGASHHIPLSDRLKESFSFRMSDFAEVTKRDLLLLALDGREDLGVLKQLQVAFDELLPAERAGLIVINQEQLSIKFSHPLIRAAVIEESSAEERRSAHLAIAEVLIDEPFRRAWHLADAAVDVDETTADLLERSAHEALRRGDAYGCARAFVRAAGLSPNLTDRRRRLAQAAYLEAEVIGEPIDASDRLEDFRNLPGREAGSLHAAVATAVVYADNGGDCGSAHRLIETAINEGSHGWSVADPELVEAFFTWFIICWQAGMPAYWDSYFAALDRLEPSCPPVLSVLSRAFADPVRLGHGVRDELQALMGTELDDADPMTIVRLTTAAVYVDLLAAGRRPTWRLIEDGRHGQALRTYFRALMVQCLDDFASGHWTRGQELADEGLTASRNTALTSSWYFVYAEALFAAVRGDVTEAGRWAAELEQTTLSREAFGIHRLAHHARTLVAEAQQDWESAYRHAVALSPPGTFQRYSADALWVAYDLVESAVRTGRHAEAAAHVRALQQLKIADLSPRLALLAHGAAALVDETSSSLPTFEKALGSTDSAAWPFDYARVQLAYGSRLRRELRLKQARAVLHSALATFETIGARPWALRARNELRAAREKVGSPEVLPSLTPQEWAIAELAAGGLSNREIGAQLYLSPRTVGGHLYRIYPKLGITSRAALRDAISALRDMPEPNTLEC
ncbi:helix-turn-helix transcriptional regulator [Mycobacterium sherrisii]|nr:LuxR family transcriptional regulator [Mycobacterium sherrisii]MCV7029697.1 AAA family ATPase [Mycobacterium sherrisii]MEC4762318.1 AAA family ATPase [Mycobacterium sherrisii]ORW74981.1 hypothetical protein AWC25_14965 [Mycobacterium sherrisii]